MKKEKLRTYPIKGLTIFAAVVFIVSVAMIVIFSMPFMNNELWVIRIVIWVMCGIFTIASGIILVYQLGFYIEIKNGCLYKHFPFGFIKIKLTEIQKIKNDDGFYVVIYKGHNFVSFASNSEDASRIIVFLEKSGVKIDW